MGAVAGALVVVVRTPRYGFLPDVKPVSSSAGRAQGGFQAFASRYVVPESAVGILDRLRQEAPLRLERTTEVGGRRAWVVTIPRSKDGRPDMAYPPAREVTVVEGAPTSVEIREFRERGPLDTLVDWVRKPTGA